MQDFICSDFQDDKEELLVKEKRRRIVHPSPVRPVRQVCLPYLQSEPIEAESSLERAFVHITALYPRCTKIEHQPFRLDLNIGSYTPDYLISFTDGSRCVVEVKPQALLAGFEQKFAQAKAQLLAHRLPFFVALDSHLHQGSRATNAMRIRRYGKSLCDTSEIDIVLNLLAAKSGLCVGQLINAGIKKETLAHLACRHLIVLSRHFGLANDDTVCLPTNNEGESDAVHFASWITA
jgi:hypothetical protein